MKTKMFYAKSMSEGLKKISAEFGDDAIILSNRKVQGGVEIMAAMEEGDEVIDTYSYEATQATSDDIIKNMANGRQPTTKAEMAALLSNIGPMSKNNKAGSGVLSGVSGQSRPQTLSDAGMKPGLLSTQDSRSSVYLQNELNTLKVKDREAKLVSREQAGELQRMQIEIQDLKILLESQSEQLVKSGSSQDYSSPWDGKTVVETIVQRLEDKSFSAPLIKKLIQGITDDTDFQSAWSQLQSRLASSFESFRVDPVKKGGIYAFVGMTGSGKTTTLSKMAARFVMENGAHDLLLITLDKFKVGSQDSLKSMSKILKCDFVVPTGTESLERILEKNQSKKLILIDTCGSFIGKEYFARQLENGRLVKRIKSLSVMPCSASYPALQRDVRANEFLQVAGVVMSKIDECPEAGSVLSVVIQEQLPMAYWSNGQKIPEDLHLVNPGQLVRTLVGKADRMSEYRDNDMKMIANF